MIDRRLFLAGGAAFAAVPGLLRAALPVPAGNRLGFDVVRKGSTLGTHVLTFEPAGNALTVQIVVDIAYKIGPITLYHYAHRATERWLDGQIASIDCRTDDNGDAFQVTGRRENGVLMVQGTKAPRYAAPANAMPATHWNRREMDGPWINTQDGRLMHPHIVQQGIETIPATRGTLQGHRYVLTGDVQLDMWYDDRLGWTGLSFTKSGVPVRYQRQG